MENTLLRLMQIGIVERRGNAVWIREALVGGHRWDLAGTVSEVDGDTLVDVEQAWPANLYGRSTADGRSRPGCRVRMLDGDAAGEVWPIETSIGTKLRVQGDVDLAAEGVGAGAAYAIERTEDDGAVTWFAQNAIRAILGYPADHQLLPCLSVLEGPSSQGSSPIGRLRTRNAPPAGPVSDSLTFEWRGTWTVSACAVQPEAAIWLARAVEHLYRQSIRLFDRIASNGPPQLQATGLQMVEIQKAPTPVHAVELTLSFTRETFADVEVDWLIDREVHVDAAARRVDPLRSR